MEMIIAILLPLIFGAALPFLKIQNRKIKIGFLSAISIVEAALALFIILSPEMSITIWSITNTLTISLRSDGICKLFIAIFAFGWLLVTIFSFKYMQHEENEDRFYSFYLLTEGALIGLSLASNLVTMYICFELATLLSMPLVLHSRTKEAIHAALKYLFYSIAGAFMALLGIFYLSNYSTSLEFTAGGCLSKTLVSGHEGLLLAIIFVTVIGFGAKAGLYPLHAWLPTAHPVAPAPASAVLSALIAKAGVLAIIRVLYYVVGPQFVAGTWVQTVLLILSLFTVFMGSMKAYREKELKRRLAYSTISQISYILTALFLFTQTAFTGALLHTVVHAAVKTCLFLTAGAIIFNTGKTRVDELKGIGKQMPITMWSFTLASIVLIGIPPTGGFTSKWLIATSALDSSLPVFSWLIPVVLLVSALLTAGYLLPITIDAFFPGKDFPVVCKRIESPVMWAPIAILAAIAVLIGIFPTLLTDFASGIASLIA